MSGSDENTGPGVQLKDALPLVPGAPSLSPCTALKPSNKANIMSPVNCGKKLDKVDAPGSMDSTIMKENVDKTMVIDPLGADDDDIISFKLPEISTTNAKEDADPFKTDIHLSNTPTKTCKSEPKSTAADAGKSQEMTGKQESEMKESHTFAATSASSEGSSSNEPEKCPNQAGPGGEEPADAMKRARAESLMNEDPFKPRSQLGNSPEKGLGCSASGDDDSSKLDVLFAESSEQTAESEKEGTLPCAVREDAESLEGNQQPLEGTNDEELLTNALSGLEITADPKSEVQPHNSANKSTSVMETALPASSSHTDRVTSAQQPDVEEDAFKAKMQLGNIPGAEKLPSSPEKCADLTGEFDPFRPKQQLLNPPDNVTDTDCSPCKPLQLLPDSQCGPDTFSEAEPFNATKKPNSSLDKAQLTKSSDDSSCSAVKELGSVQPTTPSTSSPAKAWLAEKEDPFRSRHQNANTTVGSSDNTDVEVNHQLANSLKQPADELALLDPFMPKAQLPKSPSKSDDSVADPPKPEAQLPNSPDKLDAAAADPFKPKAQLPNSPSKLDDPVADPFNPKAQLPNYPDKLNDLATDPFKPKAQLPNSPKKLDDPVADPFKSKAQLPNSPSKLDDALTDPFKPKAQLPNSPKKLDDSVADPFKPKAQLPNSPDKSDAAVAVDPFKPKAQLPNSPEKLDDPVADPFKPKAQLPNSPSKLDDALTDPFIPKAQLPNSPKKLDDPVADPFKPKAQLPSSPNKLDPVADPFKPKAQLPSSPKKLDDPVADPFKPKAQLPNSPDKLDDSVADPFKPKAQLPNSPKKLDDPVADPFKPKAQLPSSPNKLDSVADPFKPKAQLPSSPKKLDDPVPDPFKPKAQLPNSPDKLDDSVADSFKPKAQLPSSSDQSDTSDDSSQLKPKKDFRDFPEKSGKNDSLGAGEPIVQPAKTPKAEGTTSTAQSWDVHTESEPLKERKEAATVGEPEALGEEGKQGRPSNPVPVLLSSGEDLGFDENMFLPGAQFLGDSSAWDLLERFGSTGETKETDLRKCSLYVKFDPLVKSALPKTPDKMPAPMHAAPRRAVGRSHDALNASQMNASTSEESICLMGTPPRVSRRRSILNQRRLNASVSQTITEEENAVDLLFCIDGASHENQFLNHPPQPQQSAAGTLVDVEEGAKYTETQWQRLQQTLAMQYEGQLLAREQKFASQLDEMMATVTQLQGEVAKGKAEKAKLQENILSMKCVVEEYDKSLLSVVAAKEKSAEEFRSQTEEIKRERDQATEDVQALEKCFSELHRRYEKLRDVLEGFKQNEEALKKTIKMWQDKVKASEENMTKLKAKAEEKIAEVVSSKEKMAADAARLEAELKKIKLHTQSLENTLEQKSKENKDLTELCDTLINQVGGNRK